MPRVESFKLRKSHLKFAVTQVHDRVRYHSKFSCVASISPFGVFYTPFQVTFIVEDMSCKMFIAIIATKSEYFAQCFVAANRSIPRCLRLASAHRACARSFKPIRDRYERHPATLTFVYRYVSLLSVAGIYLAYSYSGHAGLSRST